MSVQKTGSESRRTSGPPLMRLSSSQFALIVASLLILLGVIGIAFAPDWQDWYARRAVKQFESEFGFQSGTVVVPDASSQPFEAWGITKVIAGGKFEQFGVRSGDIPFEYHGHGESDLYNALRDASCGKSTLFEVVNTQDRGMGNSAVRQILIPGASR
jgi:hypothetical protein